MMTFGILALLAYALLVHKAESALREHRIKQDTWENAMRALEREIERRETVRGNED